MTMNILISRASQSLSKVNRCIGEYYCMDRSNEEGCTRPKFKDKMESHLTTSFKRKLVEGEYDNDVDRFMFSILGMLKFRG